MKTKFKVFLVCFLLVCTSLFTGCTLVETDNGKLYNDAVAEIFNKEGKKVAEITNRELLSGYESYGSAYVQYYGYTKAKAVDMTLKQLENRKIVILEAEKIFGVNFDTGAGLNDLEKTYLYESTLNSFISNLDTYYKDIVGENSDEEKSDDIKFEDYDKNITLELDDKGNYYLKKVEKQDGILDGFRPADGEGVYKSYYKDEDRALIYQNFLDKAFTNKDYEKARKYYLIDLQSAEYGMGLSTGTNSMFEREIARLYKVNYENYLVQKYSDSKKYSSEIASVTTDDILRLYSSKVRASYTQYVTEKDSGYDEKVGSSLNEVYYFKNDSDSTKFFTVANILFQFSDEQKAQYKALEEKQKNEVYDSFESDMNLLYSQIKPTVRKYNEDSGIYEELENSDLSVDDIYNKLQISLSAAQATSDDGFIGDTINEYIYLYNDDPGMFNASSNYVIGVDKDGKAVSNFVEEFNKAGINLYDNGNGKVGDVALARSEYGIHALIYTGKCENLFSGIDESFELGAFGNEAEGEKAIEKLAATRVNKLVDKSYLDLLYDEIYEDNYSYFEQANLNFLREDFNFKVYKGRYSKSLKD